MNIQHVLISAWLLFRGPTNDISRHLLANPQLAVDIETAATRHQVPAALLFAIGVLESGLGSNPRARMEFGIAPADVRGACVNHGVGCGMDRMHAQMEVAARILQRGWRTCGFGVHHTISERWERAARYFRTGQCTHYRDAAGRPIENPAVGSTFTDYDKTNYAVKANSMRRVLERYGRSIAGDD